MTLPLCRFKPQTGENSLTGFRSSHLDVCTSVEHAHPSYGHIVLHMSLIPDSLTHGVKFQPKFCTLILHQCMVSSLWAEPTKREREREITRLSCFHQTTTDQGNCSTHGCCNLQVHHSNMSRVDPNIKVSKDLLRQSQYLDYLWWVDF
jgi:hypothetical protein